MPKMPYLNDGIEEVTCPVCGKIFVPAPQHVYKEKDTKNRKLLKYCSYTCFNHRHDNNQQTIK